MSGAPWVHARTGSCPRAVASVPRTGLVAADDEAVEPRAPRAAGTVVDMPTELARVPLLKRASAVAQRRRTAGPPTGRGGRRHAPRRWPSRWISSAVRPL